MRKNYNDKRNCHKIKKVQYSWKVLKVPIYRTKIYYMTVNVFVFSCYLFLAFWINLFTFKPTASN